MRVQMSPPHHQHWTLPSLLIFATVTGANWYLIVSVWICLIIYELLNILMLINLLSFSYKTIATAYFSVVLLYIFLLLICFYILHISLLLFLGMANISCSSVSFLPTYPWCPSFIRDRSGEDHVSQPHLSLVGFPKESEGVGRVCSPQADLAGICPPSLGPLCSGMSHRLLAPLQVCWKGNCSEPGSWTLLS